MKLYNIHNKTRWGPNIILIYSYKRINLNNQRMKKCLKIKCFLNFILNQIWVLSANRPFIKIPLKSHDKML